MDVIKFPRSSKGNTCAVVFMDYLTKWPEVYATKDQTSLTIAELLVKNVISRHGVPVEVLSDRGIAFLSKIMIEVYKLLGIKKSNMTAYHLQTDGMVERFHRTLTNMLAKRVHCLGKDWDEQLPYVLFAYRSSVQMSTQESPFYLLYGRDPRLPAAEVLAAPDDRRVVDVRDYKTELCRQFTEAWKLAQNKIQNAQKSQKKFYDQNATQLKVRIGDHVFVYTPNEKIGKAYKFACPYKGPYRVLKLFDNGVEVKLVSKSNSQSIRVALNCVRLCPAEIAVTDCDKPEEYIVTSETKNLESKENPSDSNDLKSSGRQGLWSRRLRSRDDQRGR